MLSPTRLYSSSPASISPQRQLAESESDNTCLQHTVEQVRRYVIRREVQPKDENKKAYTKAPKIQRLVTPQRLQHKRHRIALKRRRAESSKDAAVSPDLKRQLRLDVVLIVMYRTSTPRSCTSASRRRKRSRRR